ncbi:Protein of unknown function [Pyronema omphalodes CBS 100304]|uniref:Uncharacterized protein n=1 Tax=Pyronema omphalodes (strain CBS 100304) TaxID=1076935 RepID=U4LEM7_PYROM|nr:Protein of unknown function [Pyronema omphalodes CBS 100304]
MASTTAYAVERFLKDDEGDKWQQTLCSLCGASMPEIASEAADARDISDSISGSSSGGKPKCRTHHMVTRSMTAQTLQSAKSTGSKH